MENENQEARELYKKVLLQGIKQIIDLEDMINHTVMVSNIYEDKIKVYSEAEMFNNAMGIALILMNKQVDREKKKILNIIEKSVLDDEMQNLLMEDMPVLLQVKEYIKNKGKIELPDLMEDLLEELDDYYLEEIDEDLLFEILDRILRRILTNLNEENNANEE